MTDPDARLLALVARSPGCTANWYAKKLKADPALTLADLDRLEVAGMLKVRREEIYGRTVRVYRAQGSHERQS